MGAERMSSSGGRVAQMGLDFHFENSAVGWGGRGTHVIKNNPAMPPTGTHRAMALGSLVVGSSHSSAIDDIMPIAEKLAS